MSDPTAPFLTLGRHLKYVREQANESLAEVSGAVEIEEELLERIEAGLVRPAEDVLLLLISHFNVQDQEAVQLWESANYDSEIPDQFRPDMGDNGHRPVVMMLALDMRTMYSDGLDIICNPAGMTLNFTQVNNGQSPNVVGRIGMSYDQAERVIASLQQAVIQGRFAARQKTLPPQTDKSQSENP